MTENKLERWMKVLRKLEHTTSLSDKSLLLLETFREDEQFKFVLEYALNPYKKYGLKKLPVIQGSGPGVGKWVPVVRLLESLHTGQLTGSAAQNAVADLLTRMNSAERTLLSRIILKDLRCGLGATLVNRVEPGLIPEFGIMLATPFEEKHLKSVKQGRLVYMQAKKNGDRSVHLLDGKNGQAYSRKGHEQLNYGHITQALLDLSGGDYVFDGEVIVGDFWGTRGVKKKAGNQADNAMFHIFDITRLDDWHRRKTPPYSERRATLRKMCHNITEGMPLVRVPSWGIESANISMSDIQFWHDKFKDQGDEGLIIRPDVPYNFSTRSSLYKYKEMLEGDFPIMEIREGEAGKKYEGMAAKVLVDLSSICPGESCEVGLTGDVPFRKWLYNNRGRYVGMMCEVHYQELTENQDGTHKLQFGVMHRIREDKS